MMLTVIAAGQSAFHEHWDKATFEMIVYLALEWSYQRGEKR